MQSTVGDGEHRYRVIMDWAKLPEGWTFHEVADVAVDSRDRVYVFNRGAHPLIVFDQEGNFLKSWGEHVFKRPHGITVGPDDTLYCADDGDHTVRKYSADGELLMTLGTAGKPSPFMSGKPFNRPTKVALDPQFGALYIADGYGNAKVHKYSADGKHLLSWGESGCDPGQFNLVHSVCVDADGRVCVADRLQFFDAQGKYLTQWNNMHRPCGLYVGGTSHQLCYVGELAPQLAINENYPNLGPRVSIYTMDGQRLERLGHERPGAAPHEFWAPHGIAMDSKGDLYIGEVSWSAAGSKMDPPRELNSLRKLVKED
jgi:sugar lactone lactonase YvrE